MKPPRKANKKWPRLPRGQRRWLENYRHGLMLRIVPLGATEGHRVSFDETRGWNRRDWRRAQPRLQTAYANLNDDNSISIHGIQAGTPR